MRKVMTGEQVAQLYNRDPFALPAWRAPLYQTPAGIVLLVQLFRLIRWLVRLIARHPVAATVLAVLVPAWANLGWPGLVGLGAGGPGAWRYFWPGSFARWVTDRHGAGGGPGSTGAGGRG
jgi:DNA segregation ATPase FtsK/SpoIIIE, S-DNA-T family